MQMLKGFLGLSYKDTPSPVKTKVDEFIFEPTIIKENKINEKKNEYKLERIKSKEEKRMFDVNEDMKKPYEEFNESEVSVEKVPGEFLVEMPPELTGKPEAYYIGIRINLMALYETTDEYGHAKYFRMASHSDAYINDLSTINFGSSGSDEASMAKIRRILDMPRFTRTKLLFLNMIEVDSTGAPLTMNIEKVGVHDFMRKYKLFF